MSYREENGQVVLTMSKDQFNQLIKMTAAATVHFWPDTMWILRLMNHFNEGNPHYTPYQVEAKK